jgi:hypothetical protein
VAPTTFRWATNPQPGQENVRPLGLATLVRQLGQVELVPRWSTGSTVMPARAALSLGVRHFKGANVAGRGISVGEWIRLPST